MKTCPCCGRNCPDGLVWVYPGARQVWVDGVWVPIRPMGADILMALVEANGEVLSRGDLIDRVWGPNPPQPNTVSVHIHSLRQQLNKRLGRNVIETDYGYGFHLEGLPRRRETVQ